MPTSKQNSMNSRPAFRFATIAGLTTIAIWWWHSSSARVNVAKAPSTMAVADPDQAFAPPQLKVETPSLPPEPGVITPTDPQAELKTMLPAMIQALHTESYAAFVLRFGLPVDVAKKYPEGMLEAMAGDPAFLPPREAQRFAQMQAQVQPQMQAMAAALLSVQQDTPACDPTGSHATYGPNVPVPGRSARDITFVQQAGRWDLKLWP